MNLSKNVNVIQCLDYSAAGTEKKTSSIVDMAGYDGVMFIVGLGKLIDKGTLDAYCEQHDSNTTSGMSRVPASIAPLTVDSKMAELKQSCIIVDLFQPEKRYIQCNIDPKEQGAVILGITAIQYKGKVTPPIKDASVLAINFYQSPEDGKGK